MVRWEILWGLLPSGSDVDTSRTTKFAVRLADHVIAYCSHDLGVCEAYRTGDYRNWEAIASAPCRDERSDKDALLAFNGKPAVLAVSGELPRASSEGESSGRPANGLGVMWTTATDLGRRKEIVKQYRRTRGPQLVALKKRLRESPTHQHGVKITIPCFDSTDPEVFLSVTTANGERDVETVFWNREQSRWESADGFGFSMDPTLADELRRTIESISCAKIVL